jgi:PAS domain S-box-containing protein
MSLPAALLENDARFRAMYEHAAIGIEQVDLNGHLLMVNPALCRMLDYRQKELLGKTCDEITYPEDRARNARLLEAMLRGERDFYEIENRYCRRDGSAAWVHLTCSPVKDSRGKPLYLISIVQDITELKRAVEGFRKLNAELEERVARRTAQLTAANQELESFSFAVAHDLRAPLRHIHAFADILAEEAGPALEPLARQHLGYIREAAQHMSHLIGDLLELSRMGRRELCARDCPMGALVEEVVAGLAADVKERDIEWRIGGLPTVQCDPGLMTQVWTNLLSNALKFTRPRQRALIEVGCKDAEGTPVFYVRDNGVGFDMQYADKLFGVFQRLHRQEEFSGTGVGLAIVQRIVRKHGGWIWAKAKLDQGATFYFTLAGMPPSPKRATWPHRQGDNKEKLCP